LNCPYKKKNPEKKFYYRQISDNYPLSFFSAKKYRYKEFKNPEEKE